jgi:hypothetical protein
VATVGVATGVVSLVPRPLSLVDGEWERDGGDCVDSSLTTDECIDKKLSMRVEDGVWKEGLVGLVSRVVTVSRSPGGGVRESRV